VIDLVLFGLLINGLVVVDDWMLLLDVEKIPTRICFLYSVLMYCYTFVPSFSRLSLSSFVFVANYMGRAILSLGGRHIVLFKAVFEWASLRFKIARFLASACGRCFVSGVGPLSLAGFAALTSRT
jgi:hypothetical protein